MVELPVGARGETSGADEPSGSEPAIRDKRILVVDDEPEIGVVLEQILSTDGHSVDWASNGLAALERLSERAYDLIVSDLRMPEMDGPTLYTEVQRRYPALGARFVFLTGDALGPVMEFVAQTGAPTLGKPFAAGDVRRIVQRTFGGA